MNSGKKDLMTCQAHCNWTTSVCSEFLDYWKPWKYLTLKSIFIRKMKQVNIFFFYEYENCLISSNIWPFLNHLQLENPKLHIMSHKAQSVSFLADPVSNPSVCDTTLTCRACKILVTNLIRCLENNASTLSLYFCFASNEFLFFST